MLAWDGWYFEERPAASVDVRSLPWDDLQDMPPKLLHRANAPWLAGPLGYWLMPTYSPAHEAAELVRSRGHDSQPNATVRDAEVCAYLPIVDVAPA